MKNDYSKPLYIQLQNNIRGKITSGEYPVGSAIPSERFMSEQYGINRMTVRKSIKYLVEEGLLKRIQGKGTIVVANQAKVALGTSSLPSLSAGIVMEGMIPERKVLSIKVVSVDSDILEKFTPYKGKFVEIVRLLYANHIPYAYQKSYIPNDRFSDAIDYNFSQQSLYDYMDKKDLKPHLFTSRIFVENNQVEAAKYLEMDAERCMFYIIYIGKTQNDTVIEYTKSWHKPDYSSYKISKYRNADDK